ncbi:spore cortex-lytic enzyme [Geomicrobium sp. JSM 1781026]|uniref:spore cortex-lytic enzyme n=1 Tax=Geomicrobium sp. JSM 1781026 TaxID=3344580 RepID=UPI0035C1E874
MEMFKWSKAVSVAVLTITMISAMPQTSEAFSDQIIQKGATGDDVIELQARLQYIGYYNDTIDGVFGWGTYWSVKEYQEAFGMEVDGLVGDDLKARLDKTTNYDEAFVKEALENGRNFTHYGSTPLDIQKGPKGSKGGQSQSEGDRQQEGGGTSQAPERSGDNQDGGNQESPPPNTGNNQGGEGDGNGEQLETGEEQPEEQGNEANIHKATNVPDGFSENDIQIMANAVYGEARGEPYQGQVAVAAVIINRMNDSDFPNTASGVIFEPRAFTAVADGQIYLTPNEQARKAVLDAINGQDPSDGATYYYNPQTATSQWIFGRPTIKQIGKHVFAD